MSRQVKAWAATSPEKTEPITLTRRAPDDEDVGIDIKYVGICHTDIHTSRDEWGGTPFPIVVGHEIAGIVSVVGKNVTRFRIGDRVGVGCMVNSCRQCQSCHDGEEQYCSSNLVLTYNSKDSKDGTITQGGFSQYIVVEQAFVLSVPESIPLDKAAPLMCAGITMYSPLNHWNVGPGKKVGIIGFGGLGHMGVKFAKALGSEIIVFSQTNSKKELGIRLGADEYVATSEPDVFSKLERKLDIIINTVLYAHRIGVHGSMIGGNAETQKMLDLCGDKLIFPDIETISASNINEAYERVVKSQVQFRFVIDVLTI
ncbi:chaperonin 10-like protein [Lentinula raphanica]|nr:chaperonin 10-like protein [Lentinula raphanica]